MLFSGALLQSLGTQKPEAASSMPAASTLERTPLHPMWKHLLLRFDVAVASSEAGDGVTVGNGRESQLGRVRADIRVKA